ncbi:hypothetical protein ACHAWF_005972 [Thalassiosira exigua]
MNQSPQHHEGRPHDDHRGGGSKATTGCEDLRHFDWGGEDLLTAEVVSFSIDPACAFDRAEDRTRDEAMKSEEEYEEEDDDDEPMSFEPLPFRSDDSTGGDGGPSSSSAAFGFARANYMDGIRSWSLGVLDADRREDDAPSYPPPPLGGLPPPPPRGFSAFPAALASSMEAAVRDRAGLSRDHNYARDSPPPPCPGAVRCGEDSSSSSSEASEDDCLSTGMNLPSPSSSPPPRGVTFDERVRVLPIPSLGSYTVDQRRRMFSGRLELRENKIRNKREYEFDGCDWRNATEEGFMAICPLSGELLHPAHL